MSDQLLVLMDHQLQRRMQQRCSTSGRRYPLRERLSTTSTTTHRTTRPRARISPRATIQATCDRDVFTPAWPSAAGGGATLYVLYDGFD